MIVALRFVFSVIAASALPAGAALGQEFPKPSAEICGIYRQGPVIHQRIPIYFGRPSEDPNSFYWQDIWFRPDYIANPALEGLGRPDGLPERDLLFELDIDSGQPMPFKLRRSISPKVDNHFILLLRGGANGMPVERVIATRANAPVGSKWWGTGEMQGEFELIDVENRKKARWRKYQDNIYVASAPNNEIAVMECSAEANVPIPHCDIIEKSEMFEMDYGGLRLNQLGQLGNMRKHAQNFTACLTCNGED